MTYRISDIVEKFIRYREIDDENALTTVMNYKWSLGNFVKWFGDEKTMDAITKDVISEYKAYLKHYKKNDGKPYAHRTYYDILIALRNFLKYCHDEDIPTLSFHKVKLPKLEDSMVNFLFDYEVDAMVGAIKGSDITDKRNRAIIETFFSSGMRAGELISLDRDKIDLKWREFPVRGKNKKVRPIFISERAAKAVEDYLSARIDDFRPLFIGHASNQQSWENDGRITKRSMNRMLQAVAKEAGITKHVTCHVFRHSFATNLLINGADIREAQEFLGHASIKTTQIYTHVTNSHLREVYLRCHNKRSMKIFPEKVSQPPLDVVEYARIR